MHNLTSQVNASEALASVEIDDVEGRTFKDVNPVLATPTVLAVATFAAGFGAGYAAFGG